MKDILDNPRQAFFLGPDDIRIELLSDAKLTTVSENHQVRFFSPDTEAQQKWYVANFGATPQALGKVKVANLPGVMLLFSPVETSVTGTKGRALDHIGLEANGVKLDAPTDPWGTRIELTERSEPAPSARN
jgi:hypothetical protein